MMKILSFALIFSALFGQSVFADCAKLEGLPQTYKLVTFKDEISYNGKVIALVKDGGMRIVNPKGDLLLQIVNVDTAQGYTVLELRDCSGQFLAQTRKTRLDKINPLKQSTDYFSLALTDHVHPVEIENINDYVIFNGGGLASRYTKVPTYSSYEEYSKDKLRLGEKPRSQIIYNWFTPQTEIFSSEINNSALDTRLILGLNSLSKNGWFDLESP